MHQIRKINHELAIAGQISLEQLEQIDREGFRSVLNLRSPGEAGFIAGEQQKTEELKLKYVNLPIQIELHNDPAAPQILQQISQLPKPILIHCDNALRSAAIAFIYIATQQGTSLEQAFAQAKQLELVNVLTQV